jgi:hypothetical protein
MKHIKKYLGLFENSEHQSSREDQLQVLADLLKTGLISQSEYTKLQLDLDPDQYATFHIELEFDWDWAAGHNSTEALDLLNGWLLNDQLFPENSLIGPVDIDDWVAGDHWEQADYDELLTQEAPNYNIRVFARFDLYYNRANSLEELRQSLEKLLGRVFSSAECNGTNIDWPIEWPGLLDEAVGFRPSFLKPDVATLIHFNAEGCDVDLKPILAKILRAKDIQINSIEGGGGRYNSYSLNLDFFSERDIPHLIDDLHRELMVIWNIRIQDVTHSISNK